MKRSKSTSSVVDVDKPLLDDAVAQSLVRGNCRDPFAYLGMHETLSAQRKVVRVFLPGALSVDVYSPSGKTKLGKLNQLHPDGLFAGFIKRRTLAPYRLRIRYPLATVVIDDPYRFTSQLSDLDLYLFNQGKQERAYTFMGAHHCCVDGVDGVVFAVWAPNASRVAVVGDFNHWDGRVHGMRKHHDCGVWDIFIPGDLAYSHYKFQIHDTRGKLLPLKSDPYARHMELRPDTAAKILKPETYEWRDQRWMEVRGQKNQHAAPIAIYEVHLGSWRRGLESNRFLSYQELSEQLVNYAKDMGFTHIQLLPISEHPFDGSWGYQPIGMYAPTSRFGDPNALRHFIDVAHQHDLGVLLDWVPGHFPTDEHGLSKFDGTYLYEYADLQKGFHPDWNTLIYDYGRPEVVSYLLSNVLYWLDEFHIDGLRFDAVASMLYLDYSRKEGEWSPNQYGGRENLEAITLLRLINERAYHHHPDVMMVAEESTAWPGVTHFTDQGGLGFGYKWNLGWMNDTLMYMQRDPIHRRYHHNELTFGLLYAFDENFILPLSHDEVVHGKRSLLEKMPGDDWQKFANLRAYLAFMWSHPGKKLLFMGGEFAQRKEWNHDNSLDWHLLEYPLHRGVQSLVRDLNSLYTNAPALSALDDSPQGFEWIDVDNHADSTFIFARHDPVQQSVVVAAVNMTPTVRYDYRFGVPQPGHYRECINTDSTYYGGSGQGNLGGVAAEQIASHGKPWSVCITLPPLATVILFLENTEVP